MAQQMESPWLVWTAQDGTEYHVRMVVDEREFERAVMALSAGSVPAIDGSISIQFSVGQKP